jgi:hypothetical protein
MISHTIITMERACCLYALLIEAPIDFGSLVTSTMMSIRLTDKAVALPYGALITRISEHAKVPMGGLRETQPERGPKEARFLNASQAHLREVKPEQRSR